MLIGIIVILILINIICYYSYNIYNINNKYLFKSKPYSYNIIMSHNNKDSSIDPFLKNIIRNILTFAPLSIIRQGSYILRYGLKYIFENKLKVLQFKSINKSNINVINLHQSKYNQQMKNNYQNDVIVFIHGGGFCLCDSTDILLSEALLSILSDRLGDVSPSIYSILYQTNYQTDGSFQTIQDDIVNGYNTIIQSGKRVIAIIGDSAGGNLAMCLITHLVNSNSSNLPVVCLISPWLDLFPLSKIGQTDDDIIPYEFLQSCKRQYYGKAFLKTYEQSVINYKRVFYAKAFAEYIKSLYVKVVVFDMDQCIVRAHSHGRLLRSNLSDFLNHISTCFIFLARALHSIGIKLAIATHSDTNEYQYRNKDPKYYIIGKELVERVIDASIPELKPYVYIVSYNPNIYKNVDRNDKYKLYHLKQISQYYNVHIDECILFDDDRSNVKNTNDLFSAYQVDEHIGFNIQDSHNLVKAKLPLCYSKLHLPRYPKLLTFLLPYSISNYLTKDYRLKQLNSKEIERFNYLLPQMIDSDTIERYPKLLVIAGSNEILYEDITIYMNKLTSILYKNQSIHPFIEANNDIISDKLIFITGSNDIHVYPIFWQDILNVILKAMGLQWLNNIVKMNDKKSQKFTRRNYDIKSNDPLVDKLNIHSIKSFEAINHIANLIYEVLI